MNSESADIMPPPISFIDDDFFHRDFDFCRPEREEISVRFCMYSITYPFYVEGMPIIDETTNIYGRIFPEYNIRYPCLQWIATPEKQFPSIKYECYTSPEENTDAEKTQETIRFENEIHQFFLSFFKEDVFSSDILTTAYKGFFYEEDSATAYVFYDFSSIYELLLLSDNHILVLYEELKDGTIFAKYPFLRKIKGYHSPSLLYMCIYDKEQDAFVNVDVDMEPSKYMLPQEHSILGCTAYYFTESPLDTTIDMSRLVRFACIQSRIMYEVRIEGEEVFYMGDNVSEFREDFEMGVLMCSTIHFEENGRRFIGIKSGEMWFPLVRGKSTMSLPI